MPGIHRALQKAPTRPCVLVLLWIARLVKIESDPLCKAHYFTHPQNGQTLAAYGDNAPIDADNGDILVIPGRYLARYRPQDTL